MTLRQQQRQKFLKQHGLEHAALEPLAQDASARRYFRLSGTQPNMLLMDAPPELESCQQFYTMTKHLESLGALVPHIFHHDLKHGFLLIADFGTQTFTKLLANNIDETSLYHQATNALCDIQLNPENTDINLPPYDLEPILREANLFLEWYLPFINSKIDGNTVDKTTMFAEYQSIWQSLYSALKPLPETLVLRDFHVDNLMLYNNRCAFLDYQDALIGSPVYDLVSLLEDARRDVSKQVYTQCLNDYCRRMDFDPEIVNAHFRVWGTQRHAKVAGIFVRLYIRDKKPDYLQHLDRVISLMMRHLAHPQMAALNDWVTMYFPQRRHIIKTSS